MTSLTAASALATSCSTYLQTECATFKGTSLQRVKPLHFKGKTYDKDLSFASSFPSPTIGIVGPSNTANLYIKEGSLSNTSGK